MWFLWRSGAQTLLKELAEQLRAGEAADEERPSTLPLLVRVRVRVRVRS